METHLAMSLIEELMQRTCNSKVRVRLGTDLNVERFLAVFRRFAEGTYFERVSLEIEQGTGKEFEILVPAPPAKQ